MTRKFLTDDELLKIIEQWDDSEDEYENSENIDENEGNIIITQGNHCIDEKEDENKTSNIDVDMANEIDESSSCLRSEDVNRTKEKKMYIHDAFGKKQHLKQIIIMISKGILPYQMILWSCLLLSPFFHTFLIMKL